MNNGIDGAKARIMGWVESAKKSKVLNKIINGIKENWYMLLGALPALFIRLNGGIDGTKEKLASWFKALVSWYNSDKTQAWIQAAVTAFNRLATMAGQAFGWLQAQAVKYWPAIQAVAMVVINGLVNGFKWIMDTANKYWPTIQNAIVGAWEQIKTNILPGLMVLIKVFVDAFKKIWAVVVPLVKGIFNFFRAIAPTVMVLVGIIAWAVTKILWPAILIIAKVFMNVAAAVIPVVVTIVTSIVKAFTKVLNWFSVIWPAILKIIKFAFGVIMFLWAALGPYIMAALEVIGSIITGAFKVIMAVVKFVWTTISSIIKIAWGIISGIIETALGILTGDWEMAWNAFKGIFEDVWDGIKDFLGGIGKMFYDSGKAIITTLVDGIKSVAKAPGEAIKGVLGKVRDFLPFSDAKRGPLSTLTYSGGAVMTTLATGVRKKQGALQDAVSNAFTGIDTPSIVPPRLESTELDMKATPIVTPRLESTKLDMKATSMAVTPKMNQTEGFNIDVNKQANVLRDTIMSAFSDGVSILVRNLKEAVIGAFSETAMGMQKPSVSTAPELAPVESFSAAGSTISPAQVSAVTAPPAKAGGDINIASLVGKIDIYAQPGDNASDLVDQVIDQLYTKAKEATAILTSANKGRWYDYPWYQGSDNY